jgi:hypothetical protein
MIPRRTDGQINPGDVRFLDLNKDGVVDDQDRTIIGSPQPKINYGFSAGAELSKVLISACFFIGVGGNKIYNADRMQGLDASYSFQPLCLQKLQDRWHGTGNKQHSSKSKY